MITGDLYIKPSISSNGRNGHGKLEGSKRVRLIVKYGINGAGKDTQAALLAKGIGAEVISTGDIFRSARDKVGKFAAYHDLIEPYIEHANAGGLIPTEVIYGILGEYIKDLVGSKETNAEQTIIITGGIRREDQIKPFNQLQQELKEQGITTRVQHINYELKEHEAKLRANLRRSVAIFNNQKPRIDDEARTVAYRFELYRRETRHVINHLTEEGKMLTVPATGTVENIQLLTRIAVDPEVMVKALSPRTEPLDPAKRLITEKEHRAGGPVTRTEIYAADGKTTLSTVTPESCFSRRGKER